MTALREQAAEFYASTVLAGRVVAQRPDARIVVAALHRPDGTIAHHVVLHGPGGYELIVPEGNYDVVAFEDANRNFAFDAEEASGRASAPVRAAGSGTVMAVDIVLARNAPALPVGREFAPRRDTQAGAIARLDDPIFDPAFGRKGYWEPMSFFREAGGNIHFLEPYDPARVPVLFIHGAGGSARDWHYFVDRLDRSRYQAWLFHYPSGASVESMAHLLYWKLFNLQVLHRFDRMHLTAHSMGGLVARRFLVDHGTRFPQVNAFITLSTPWAGEALADLGVKHSPAVIPSWRDMQPDGPFMREIFERPLPAGVEHYLFFGHKGGGFNLVRPNNDGAVTLASQLRPDAQAQARRVMGFDEDHVGILNSPRVFAQCAAILDRATGSSSSPLSGALRVEFNSEAGTPPLPVLMLSPVEGGERTYMALSPEDARREVGPVAPGTYEVSLLAGGFRAEPERALAIVSEGEAPTVRFRLLPQGTLVGHVTAKPDAMRNPAGTYSAPGRGVAEATVRIEGAGVDREAPPGHDIGECLDRFAASTDCSVEGQFWFTGLPEGDYRLTVSAPGFAPHESLHRVSPGQAVPWSPIELEPL